MCERLPGESLIVWFGKYLVQHTASAFIIVALLATCYLYLDFKELSKSQVEVNTQILLELQSMNMRIANLEKDK